MSSTTPQYVGGWGLPLFNNSFYPIALETPTTTIEGVQYARTACNILEIKCAWTYSLFLTGQIFCVGNFPVASPQQKAPHVVSFHQQATITRIGCGRTLALAISDSGVVYSWGINSGNQLGREGEPSTPLPIALPKNARALRVAACDCLGVVAMDNKIYCTGEISGDKLRSQTSITEVIIPAKIQEISCGAAHCAVITVNGQLLTWGWGAYGQLGHDTLEDCTSPQIVSALEGIFVTHIACGSWHSACVSADEATYTWGWNKWGQLGHSSGKNYAATIATPTLVEFSEGNDQQELSDEENILFVECGSKHTVLLNTHGSLYIVGEMRSTNNITQFPTITKIPLPFKVTTVSAHDWSTIFLMQGS